MVYFCLIHDLIWILHVSILGVLIFGVFGILQVCMKLLFLQFYIFYRQNEVQNRLRPFDTGHSVLRAEIVQGFTCAGRTQ